MSKLLFFTISLLLLTPAVFAFSPPQTTHLKLWLNADAGITKNGNDVVTAWADQSGNNRTVNVIGQPLWQASGTGYASTIAFDGTSCFTTSTFALNNITIFSVMQSTNNTGRRLYSHGNMPSMMDYMHLSIVDQNGPNTFAGQVGFRWSGKNYSAATSLADGTFKIVRQRCGTTHASNMLAINGVDATLEDQEYFTSDPGSTPYGSYAFNVGADYYGSNKFIGQLAEILVYDSAFD